MVDIALRVVMGKLLTPDVAPAGDAPFTDGATVDARMFADTFPYLNPPIPGSPNDPSVTVVVQSAATVNGPFNNTPATYDTATRTLSSPKAGPDAGFYRLKADGKIRLDGITVGP